MSEIEVVRRSGLKGTAPTSQIVRERAFESENAVVTLSRVPGGGRTDWHHHGDREIYGYLVSGSLRLEFGLAGTKWVALLAGDFFHLPTGLIHRDVNPDLVLEGVVVNVSLGKGPTVVAVDRPL